MAMAMVRRQVELPQKQNEKVKILAEQRGCTEDEVIRDAVDQLPEPEAPFVDRLRAAGLLATIEFPDDLPTREELVRLEAEHEAWVRGLPQPLGLAEAVLADREESPY